MNNRTYKLKFPFVLSHITRRTVALFFVLCFGSVCSMANGFRLIDKGKGATIYYWGKEPVVNTAIDMLVADSRLVCNTPHTRMSSDFHPAAGGRLSRTVFVGTLGQNASFDSLIVRHHICTDSLLGVWEGYRIETAEDAQGAYAFVIGSDARGTAYGVLELSRCMGVTPWVWWADVIPEKKELVTVQTDHKTHAPSVQYRGIFLNDEDWALMPWSTRTFEPTSQRGAIGPKTYARVFELLLRLRANTIWPAMHECTVPFFKVKGNREMAKKYGIVVSTSHAEPMMRTNTGEWNNKKNGAFNFLSNKQTVLNYWEERVKELQGDENIYTIGMRGIHDGRMQGVNTLNDETRVLQDVINAQREMLHRYHPDKKITAIPQQFVPYKEVLKAYDNGLKVPEDAMLVWCDDNFGHIMRLSDEKEQKRKGGVGVYYHISYYGKPHDYLWLATTQPGQIYAEMKCAWDTNARRLWILNVGDIKPGEYLTEFFLDMAWDIHAFSGDKIYAHQRAWMERMFGNRSAAKIDAVMRAYYRLAGQRKPEHLGWNQVLDPKMWSKENEGGNQPVKDSELSPDVFGDEIERRISAYDSLALQSAEIYKEIPSRLKDAYFQLVHYPVCASSAMNRKMLYAQKSRLYAQRRDTTLAAYYAALAMDAYHEIASLDYTYNKDMAQGKWELMMDMKPRDLPVFQAPVLPRLSERLIAEAELKRLQGKAELPVTAPLTPLAGTPNEDDYMIALNACNHSNPLSLEKIEGLGHSGMAVRLPANARLSRKGAFLEYRIHTVSTGLARIKIGTVPMFPSQGKELRYAVEIDGQKPRVLSATLHFQEGRWAEDILRNQTLLQFETSFSRPGSHTLRIYAMDEAMFFDQLMVDFNVKRAHYLIPVP